MRFRPELLALMLIVGFLSVMISLSHREDIDLRQTDNSQVLRSSYRNFPEGYKALYLTLDRLGFTVRRQIQFYAQLPRRGLLIVADPYAREITDFEKRQLARWIASGNHALILLEHHSDQMLPANAGYREGAGGKLPAGAAGIPAAILSKLLQGDQVTEAKPLAPTELSALAPKLAVKTTYRFDADKSLEVTFTGTPVGTAWLYADPAGPVVAYSSIGRGGIFWCTSPWSFSNQGLRQHQENLDFILALAGLQPDTPIIFDEYHHNYGAGASLWSVAPMLTRLGILQLAIAFLLLLLTLAWRFGAMQLPMEERFSRSRAEYLTSMADLLGRVRATHVVVRRLRARLGRALGRRLGLPVNASPRQLIEANAGHPLVDQMLLMRTCRELELLENIPRPDEDTVLHLAQNIERLVSLKGKR